MVKCCQKAHKMRHRCQEYENVEDLVRATPNIKPPGLEPFRYPCLPVTMSALQAGAMNRQRLGTHRVECSADDVEETLQNYPVKAHRVLHLVYTIHSHPM